MGAPDRLRPCLREAEVLDLPFLDKFLYGTGNVLDRNFQEPLAIYLAPVPDANDQDEQPVVLDLGDETIVAYSVFPKFAETLTVQCLTNAAGVLHRSDAVLQELADALAYAPVELLHLPKRSFSKLNRPSQDALRPRPRYRFALYPPEPVLESARLRSE